MVLDETTSSGVNTTVNTSVNGTTTTTIKDQDAPKLRTNKTEEYRKWKRYIKWWQNGTKMPAERQAAHLIMNAILDEEVSEIVHELSDQEVYAANGVENLIQTLDEYFLSNTESRLFKFWRAMRKHEKTESMTWTQYIKETKRVFKDLEKFGLNLGDKVVAIAMIEATELEASTQLHIESMARNLHPNHELNTKNVEESIRRLIMEDIEHKVMEVAEIKQAKEDNDESTNTGCEEALWMRSSRYQRGGRFRRNYSNVRGNNSNNTRALRATRGGRGFRRPHNRCYTCDSDRHYAAQCDAEQSQFTGIVSQVNMHSSNEDSFEIFACTHMTNLKLVSLFIDTGATKTVIGENTLAQLTQNWKDQHKHSLFQNAQKDNCTKFKFGDNRQVRANNIIHMPIKMMTRVVKLKTFVLPGNVSFLLGMEAMKSMQRKNKSHGQFHRTDGRQNVLQC